METTIAIGGVILPLIGGAIGWFFLTARSTLTASVTPMVFRGDQLIERNILTGEQVRSTLGATRIEIQNRAMKHISDVVIFYDFIGENWIAEVASCRSISKELVTFDRSEDSLKITFKEFPRGEHIWINFVQRGLFGYNDRIRGGANNFKLISELDYRENRLTRTIVGLFVGIMLAQAIVPALQTHFATVPSKKG